MWQVRQVWRQARVVLELVGCCCGAGGGAGGGVGERESVEERRAAGAATVALRQRLAARVARL